MSTAKEIRVEIGGDILISMAANEEFPLGNIHRVSKIMQEYFVSEGFEDILKEQGYSWRPDADYWLRHLKEIRSYLRHERKLFLEFLRDNGTFQGEWKFLRKGEFENVMIRERAGLGTRAENYNDRLGDGKSKWKLDHPFIKQENVELIEEAL